MRRLNGILQWVGTLADVPFAFFAVLFILALANAAFPPLPLESAVLFAGFLTGAGHGSPVVVIAAASAGTVIAQTLLYLLSRRHGRVILTRIPFGRQILDGGAFDRAGRWLARYGVWSLFFSKFVPGMCLAAVLSCGVLRCRAVKALPAILISNLVFFVGLVLLAEALGARWRAAAAWLAGLGLFMLAVLALAAGFALVFFLLRRKAGNGLL